MRTDILALVWIIIKCLLLLVPLLVGVLYLTYAERKVIGYMQARFGPNRVGLGGLLQPLADALKLLNKEIILPSASNRYLYIVAPVLSVAPALAAWAVMPFAQGWHLADVNAGLLYIMAVSSFGVYGIMIAGWASNSKYALFGSLRSAAQMVSYEIAMGFAVVGVMIASDSTNLSQIVNAQVGGLWHWYWLPLLPLFVIYWISGVAETNRTPFDVAEGESEIVAGYHVEYAGMTFAMFFFAEYINMMLISCLAVVMFMGGWLSPFESVPFLQSMFTWVPGIAWFLIKAVFFLYLLIWMRATFPRYRYDQIMRLGWKVLIPVTLLWVVLVALAVKFQLPPWFG